MLFSRGDKGEEKKPKKQSTLGFLFNPQIGRDVRPLVESAGMFVRMLALILASYRLFPKDHPAFKDNNVRLTFSEVLSTSFNTLQFTRQGIPQILAFIAVFGCIVFTVLFLITLVFSALTGSAHAQLFDGQQNAPNDWARQWVDYLFMGKEMENVSDAITPPKSTDFQRALGAALSLYSTAVLALAGFLLIYHLTFMIAETAHTGKPMGRANQIWAPIRLVFAIGMLVPIGTAGGGGTVVGYNTAQYLGMQVARWGSGLASNIWFGFLTTLQDATQIGCNADNPNSPACLTAPQQAPDIVRGLVASDACVRILQYYIDHAAVGPGSTITASWWQLLGETGAATVATAGMGVDDQFTIPTISSYAGKLTGTGSGRTYLGMTVFSDTNIERSDLDHLCGGIELIPPPSADSLYVSVINAQRRAVADILPRVREFTRTTVPDVLPSAPQYGRVSRTAKATGIGAITVELQGKLNSAVRDNLRTADTATAAQAKTAINNAHFTSTGWLTAASWFNRVVNLYADRSAAVYNALPVMIRPTLSFTAQTEAKDKAITGILRDSAIAYATYNTSIGSALTRADSRSSSASGAGSVAATSQVDLSEDKESVAERILSSGLVNGVLMLVDSLGQHLNMWRENGQLSLQFGSTLNPIGELAAFGHNTLNSVLSLLNWGGILFALSAVADSSIIANLITLGGSSFLGHMMEAVASLMFAIAGLLIAAGFTLSYLVPLFPFYRFFFASITWLMSVFELVVLAPLFALAHVTPYGDGLSGGYKYGYSVFLQVLLRPVLMVFGLVAGYLIFSAALHFLNDAFMIATAGTGAANAGASNIKLIGRLAFLIIYCLIVFVLANQAFSTIGLFPQVAMSWLNMNKTQEEGMGNAAQTVGLVSAYLGKEVLSSNVSSALKSGGGGISAGRKAIQARDDKKTAADAQEARDKKQDQLLSTTEQIRENTQNTATNTLETSENTAQISDHTKDTRNSAQSIDSKI